MKKNTKNKKQEKMPLLITLLKGWLFFSYIIFSYLFYMHADALYIGIILLISFLFSGLTFFIYRPIFLSHGEGQNTLRFVIAYFISTITVIAYSFAMIKSNQMSDTVRLIIIAGSALVMYSIYASLEGILQQKKNK